MKNTLIKAAVAAMVSILSGAVTAEGLGGGTEVDLDLQVVVGICTGNSANCPVTVTKGKAGSISGDEVNFAGFEKVDLGTIDQPGWRLLSLPLENKGKIYTFTPTKGELKDLPVEIAIHRLTTPGVGQKGAGLAIFNLYRHVSGQTPEWARFAILSKKMAPKSWGFMFRPNGSILLPNGKEVDLSSKKLITPKG